MLKKPIYVNYQHEIAVETYFDLVYVTIKELCGSDVEKFEDFIHISNVIIDHHNNYKHNTNEGNYLDFMSIIPTNFTAMVNGFLTGIENKENKSSVRIYQEIITNHAYKLVKELEVIKLTNE